MDNSTITEYGEKSQECCKKDWHTEKWIKKETRYRRYRRRERVESSSLSFLTVFCAELSSWDQDQCR